MALSGLLASCGSGAASPPASVAESATGSPPEVIPSPEVQAAPRPDSVVAADIFEARCASCHGDPDDGRALSVDALATLNPAHIVFVMMNGSMRTHAEGLSLPQVLLVAQYIGANREPYRPAEEHYCADRSVDATPVIGRWGVDADNSGAVPAGASRIDSRNVAGLDLAWAFGLPQVADARSQPVVTETTLFVAATSGHLFALDRRSGCIRWHRSTTAPPRTALTLGTVQGRPALVYGDGEAHVNAVDARTGETMWRSEARVSEHSTLTGAPIQHEGRVIVPVSMYEVGLAADPAYECCRSHGAVLALDADTGERIWTFETTGEAEPIGETSVGTRIWAPSGAAVWSTPTIDPERGLVYVGTGQNATRPATEHSDAVLALELETGRLAWHRQTIAGDAYNQACDSRPPGPNCPTPPGPDHDIGASVVLTTDATGNDRLIVGQKSGDVFALDPEDGGRIVWHRRVAAGSPLGGVHWGLAVTDGRVFAPSADPDFPFPNYRPKPGLTALRVDDGAVLWESPVERGCETNVFAYFGRAELYPECPFFFALSSPPLVVDDVVFTAALDGRVRAHSTEDGRVLWEVGTAREFATMNGVDARGGSIDVAGVQVAGDMLYVQSGYAQFGQLPGNVLLGFVVE